MATCRKFKIPDHQNGQVYLTSHRICYVDNGDPRKNSTAIDLKDVERYEFYVCLCWQTAFRLLIHAGWLLEILSKDHSCTQTYQTILNPKPSSINPQWPIQECNCITSSFR